eukprot:8050398-Pyramimonas_sp.AAC.1
MRSDRQMHDGAAAPPVHCALCTVSSQDTSQATLGARVHWFSRVCPRRRLSPAARLARRAG